MCLIGFQGRLWPPFNYRSQATYTLVYTGRSRQAVYLQFRCETRAKARRAERSNRRGENAG